MCCSVMCSKKHLSDWDMHLSDWDKHLSDWDMLVSV